MSGRRGYALTLLVLAASAIAAIVVTGFAWISAFYTLPGQTWSEGLSLSGRDLAPLAVGGGWIALACIVGIVATAGVVRRALGVVVAAAGTAVAVGAVVGMSTAPAAMAVAIAREGGTLEAQLTLGMWSAVAAAAGVLTLLCGLATAARGATWPTMSARYERSPKPRSDDPWAALDRGEDPTA